MSIRTTLSDCHLISLQSQFYPSNLQMSYSGCFALKRFKPDLQQCKVHILPAAWERSAPSVLHVNSSGVNLFFSHRSIQVLIWTCEPEIPSAQFTGQIVSNIVTAGSRAFCWSVFFFSLVQCVGVVYMSGNTVKTLMRTWWQNGEEGREEEGNRVR